jgi:hypothetical protein
MQFALIGGRAECVGLEMRSFREDDDPLPRAVKAQLPARSDATETVSATLVKSLPIGRIIDEARSTGAMYGELVETELGRVLVPGFHAEAFLAPSTKRGRPVQWTHERLAEVAQVYRGAWFSGKPPRKAVAAHFHLEDGAAGKLVSRARPAGLLGETTRGRGGLGTPKGKRKEKG